MGMCVLLPMVKCVTMLLTDSAHIIFIVNRQENILWCCEGNEKIQASHIIKYICDVWMYNLCKVSALL